MSKAGNAEKKISGILAAVLCPVLITSVCLLLRKMFPGQENTLVYGDYPGEYLPFFRYFWNSLLHGKIPDYSFSLGLGSPTLAMNSIFVFSPFSIIAYLIDDVNFAAYIMWMLKLSLASAAFYLYSIKELKCRQTTAFVFSMFYSMSAYMMIYYNNIHFIDVLYILPVLMHFLLVYIREGRRIGLTLCYAFCFINNFYDGFCVGVFSFVIYIALLWYTDLRGERLKKSLAGFMCSAFIAALLSSPVILPAVMFVIQHMRGGSDFSSIPLRSPLYIINSLLFGRRIYSIFDTMPEVYCGWPAILMTVYFFTDKGEKKKKILAAVPLMFLLICFFWHPAYFAMHLFNEPDSFPWRFSFLLIFMLACIAAYKYDHTEKSVFSMPRIITLCVLVLICGGAYYLNRNEFINGDILPLFVFGINLVFVILHFIGDSKLSVFCMLAVLEAGCAAYFQLPQTQFDTFSRQDMTVEAERMNALKAEMDTDDQAFFRADVVSSYPNKSLLYGFNGVDYFCSFDNNSVNDALKLLGLKGRPQQYSNRGNTEFTNMILSVKYTGSSYNGELYENGEVLPLAFSVTEEIKKLKLSENPFENQQALADAMTVNDGELYKPVNVSVNTNKGAELEFNDDGSYTFRKLAGGGAGYWSLDDDDGQPAYMYISSGERASGLFDEERILEGYPVATYSALSVPFIYRFYSPDEETQPLVFLVMDGDAGSEVTVGDVTARRLDTQALHCIYEELEPLGMNIDSFTDKRIHGTVNADPAHTVLFTSIPYDVNWHVFIDGKECDTYSVINAAFLACDITPGMHEIELVYRDSSAVMGWGMFAVGILLLLLQLRKKEEDKNGKNI